MKLFEVAGADVRAIYDRLVQLPEFEHLRDGEAVVDFLLRDGEEIKQGRLVLGAVHLPGVQGQLKPVFDWMLRNLLGRSPDFLVILDRDYWLGADERSREILMYHEMCHMIQKVDADGEPRFDDEGRPVFGLIGHDVEDFIAVVRRYGAYSDEIRQFIAAATEGGHVPAG